MNLMTENKLFNNWMYANRKEGDDYIDRFNSFLDWLECNDVEWKELNGIIPIIFDGLQMWNIEPEYDDNEQYDDSGRSITERLVDLPMSVSFNSDDVYVKISGRLSGKWVSMFMGNKFRLVLEPIMEE